MSMLPHVSNFCKSAFYHLSTISRTGKYLSSQTILLRFLFTPLGLQNSITAILYYILMSLKTSSKSFNRCWVQLPDWLHALRGVIKSLPSSSVFTGYLFLNELNSSFYYLPSRLCISNLQPTFTQDLITRYLPSRPLRSSSTLSLNPVSCLSPRSWEQTTWRYTLMRESKYF